MNDQRFLPGATIGVMGGGQLGRMFAIAARRMGYLVQVFTPEEESPAGQFADMTRIADYNNEAAVRRFVEEVDVITFEFENIPIETVEFCAQNCVVRPAGSILHIAQNRLREKEYLSSAGVPIAPFRAVRNAGELANSIEQIGRPAILKTAAFGYDGKGQQMINSREDFDEIWNASSADQLVLESAIDFEKEVSVIVARGVDGATATFPVCENIHRNHILDITIAPARIPENVERDAKALACDMAEKLELVGLLAVEMFLTKSGELLVNELAPRPHNSGHWTIEGCTTSQFEQQVRAVCGLPLGSTEILRPAAMANLLGEIWQNGEPDWSKAFEADGVHLHLYGKSEPRPRRKMGHLTALGKTADEAFARVSEARAALQLAK
ncbi:MAG: 5-(carboxyamino)imidazole ribonucleotide synthase [Chthoniobacterales bacterium]